MASYKSKLRLWSIIWRLFLLLAAGVAALLPVVPVGADTGPKPTMAFTFVFDGPAIAIIGGEQLECQDAQCQTAKPLEVGGPQRFTCTGTECSSLAYGYAPYHKLVIQFADRTRESNVFQKSAFGATYEVKVTEDALQVRETSSPIAGRCCCCPSTLVAAAGVGMALLKLRFLA